MKASIQILVIISLLNLQIGPTNGLAVPPHLAQYTKTGLELHSRFGANGLLKGQKIGSDVVQIVNGYGNFAVQLVNHLPGGSTIAQPENIASKLSNEIASPEILSNFQNYVGMGILVINAAYQKYQMDKLVGTMEDIASTLRTLKQDTTRIESIIKKIKASSAEVSGKLGSFSISTSRGEIDFLLKFLEGTLPLVKDAKDRIAYLLHTLERDILLSTQLKDQFRDNFVNQGLAAIASFLTAWTKPILAPFEIPNGIVASYFSIRYKLKEWEVSGHIAKLNSLIDTLLEYESNLSEMETHMESVMLQLGYARQVKSDEFRNNMVAFALVGVLVIIIFADKSHSRSNFTAIILILIVVLIGIKLVQPSVLIYLRGKIYDIIFI
ncbi:uncharacterized protein LOC110856574 [Folsomia candida]|uniref:uncharacterized protein LOC110856574 n=1 Tax=Folsomia candida TaxID=158441 RepID=UPI000B8FC2A1|nr:uncharacterized protein LOC110856574 [Folsomia candida]